MQQSLIKSWHPRRWHLLTWTVFLLWLFFGSVGNYPFSPPEEALGESIPVEDGASGGTFVSTSYTMLSGWPLFYLQRHVNPPSTHVVVEFNSLKFLVNVVLIGLTQFSIVVVMQRFGQFSIAMLFAAVTLVALVLLGGRIIVANDAGFGMLYYIRAIYFLPILGALVVMILALGGRARGQVELSAPPPTA